MEMHSPEMNELATALSKMQGSMPPVFKNKTAKILTKSGSSYSYAYADLTGIWDCIRQSLMDVGLSICQTFSDGMIVTILMHSSGQWIKSCLPLHCSREIRPQELGSIITYMRRYALTSILGISADEDDDCENTNHHTIKTSSKEEDHDDINNYTIKNPVNKKEEEKEIIFIIPKKYDEKKVGKYIDELSKHYGKSPSGLKKQAMENSKSFWDSYEGWLAKKTTPSPQ